MQLPGLDALITERRAFVETLDGLSDEEFDDGPTLCEGWAPRDVLAHVMGVDTAMYAYVKALGSPSKGNALQVEAGRHQRRDRLMHRARHWAEHPAPLMRAGALFFLGDISVHHQDVLRPNGRRYDLPAASRDAIFREGLVLGGFLKLNRYRVEATDGGPRLGRGAVVRGTTDALGLWLSGRAVEADLQFDR